MMEFNNEKLGVKFSIPDRPTVGQVLTYRGILWGGRPIIDAWEAAATLIDKWECELIKTPQDIDYASEENTFEITDVMMWVGNTTAGFMADLGQPRKNS